MILNRFRTWIAKDSFWISLLFLTTVIIFWQLSLLKYCMHHDIMTLSYPWRYFIGESLQNGFLPLWNPYQEMGWSQHTDPQSWYPVSMLIGWITGYPVYIIALEYLLHIFLAGIGMYRLASWYRISRPVAYITACAYMCSGFMVGNAQHLGWIVSAAWIPFIVYEMHRLITAPALSPALKMAVYAWMLFTGGYIVFDILLFYIFLGVLPFVIAYRIRRKETGMLKRFAAYAGVAAGAFLLLALPALYSMLDTFWDFTRSQPLAFGDAKWLSSRPSHLLSLVYPFLMAAEPETWRTDVSMSHLFIGILALPLIFVGLCYGARRLRWVWFVTGLVFLAGAMAEDLPVRKWMFDYLPLLDSFRFPPLLRFFFLFSCCLLSGMGLEEALRTSAARRWIYGFGIALALAAVSLIAVHAGLLSQVSRALSASVLKYVSKSTIPEAILLQSIAYASIALITATIFFLMRKSNNRFLIFVVSVQLLSIFAAAQWVMQVTALSVERPLKIQRKCSPEFARGFPVHPLQPMREISQEGSGCGPLWRNYPVMQNRTSHDGYLPYNYVSSMEFFRSGIREIVLSNPLIYFPSENADLAFMNDTAAISMLRLQDASVVFTAAPLPGFSSGSGKNKSTVLAINPYGITVSAEMQQDGYLVLQQNFTKRWWVAVDGKEVPLLQANHCQMMALIPGGSHRVEFRYGHSDLMAMFCVSVATLLVVLSGLALDRKKKSPSQG